MDYGALPEAATLGTSDRVRTRRLRETEDRAGDGVGPGVLEVDAFLALDGEVALLGGKEGVYVMPTIPSWTSMNVGMSAVPSVRPARGLLLPLRRGGSSVPGHGATAESAGPRAVDG